jgi:hypothetical protein
VHCSASSHGHVTGSCKHVGIVLRFKNKWRYTTTPPYAIMAWPATNLPFLPPPKTAIFPLSIKPERSKAYYSDIRNELTNIFRTGKKKQSVSAMCRQVAHSRWGNISVTIHQLHELWLPLQGRRRTSLFRYVTQQRLVASNRRFGITYRYYLQG